ncbi:hypothetical protein PROFUN_05788 [Planoprotostelium fungivorum]|uniref:Uncharacterized protein n=1 Tax=Planoprotostelium fungivorum TaxID=1890364 RepID=A0A2P6NPY5_9EUKA|nr:hypothetical protein PROFUN_05788 [Planoprotostelium fungivorum]
MFGNSPGEAYVSSIWISTSMHRAGHIFESLRLHGDAAQTPKDIQHNQTPARSSTSQTRRLMSNGIISSHDVTRVVLEMVMSSRDEPTRRTQFAALRLTCKSWKEIVDSFTLRLSEDDFHVAIEEDHVESLCFLLTHESSHELLDRYQFLYLIVYALKNESTDIATTDCYQIWHR